MNKIFMKKTAKPHKDMFYLWQSHYPLGLPLNPGPPAPTSQMMGLEWPKMSNFHKDDIITL